MADSLKRITMAKSLQFQDRVNYYLFQKALAVMAESTPDADDLSFAKLIYVNEHNIDACAKIVVSNSTIGANIDTDSTIPEADIEYVVLTDQYHNMSVAANT